MECSCLVDPDIDDCVTWEENTTAYCAESKIPRVCCECGREMEPGERYLLEVVRWGGRGRCKKDYRTCRDCESLRDYLCCNWYYGNILEDIEAALEEMPEDSFPWATFAKLTPVAREFVFDIIEYRWADDGRWEG